MPKLIAVVFTIAFLLALVLLGYHALAWVRGAYSELEADVAALLVVASTVLVLCSLFLAAAVRSLGHDRIAARRWLARAETYELCLELIQQPDRGSSSEAWSATDRRVALHAGQNVVRRYGVLRQASAKAARNGQALDDLLLAMRRDLGGSAMGIGKGDLTALLLERPVERRGADGSLDAAP